ncbi:hypothetical protein [Desulfobulbus elongatus]|uniref:hypothetical protein n=1 Tax=Desulfobulbus elongatus TaxID=53332 RepID=UPI000554D8CB|nr:hypothetical protein [Desulfobulbus elongatus]
MRKTRKSCREKKRYASQAAANRRAVELNRKGVRIKPYWCPVCGGWHMTHRSPTAVLNEAFVEAGLAPVYV